MIEDFDYVELYVGNAHQAVHFYRTTFGFQPLAYAGLETTGNDWVSYVMQQGRIRLLLTAAVSSESRIAKHVQLHGDSVRDVAFEVNDVRQAFAVAVKHGAMPTMAPTLFEDQNGCLIKATIAAFGHIVHSFTQRIGSRHTFSPSYRAIGKVPPALSTGLISIDHIAINVEEGALNQWVDFYENVLGFYQSHQEDIFTEHSAMNSKVMQNDNGRIKISIIEPAPGRYKSQIEEYLEFNRGPGVQHVAFLSGNIIETVRLLRKNNIEFLSSPDTYYQMLEDRIGKIDEDLNSLRELGILVDRDQWGHLFQIFSKPIQSRPTLFIEIIQRIGARGFGSGNIRALFEAVEREQAIRGNL